MKNFKKMIFLSIIIIIVVIYLIYNYTSENVEEIIAEEIYVESNPDSELETIGKIILHITGEVKKPRNYSNR